jgi:hypothetical protein
VVCSLPWQASERIHEGELLVQYTVHKLCTAQSTCTNVEAHQRSKTYLRPGSAPLEKPRWRPHPPDIPSAPGPAPGSAHATRRASSLLRPFRRRPTSPPPQPPPDVASSSAAAPSSLAGALRPRIPAWADLHGGAPGTACRPSFSPPTSWRRLGYRLPP